MLCLLLGTLARAEPYQVVTEEWAPYNYQENNQLTGMATEIVRTIMAMTGDDFEIVLLPSMRTTQVLQTRPKTIMYSLFRTAEREQMYKWVGPIAEESFHPYQLASSPTQINTLEQLLRARGIQVDTDGFNAALEKAREAARASIAYSKVAGSMPLGPCSNHAFASGRNRNHSDANCITVSTTVMIACGTGRAEYCRTEWRFFM